MRSKTEGVLQQVMEHLLQMLKREMREQSQENKTTSFHAGNNNVGIDSFPPSILGFPGYNLQTPPKISTFCGEKAPGRNEVSLEQWFLEIGSAQGLYSEPFLREAVIKSLKEVAADLVIYMGSQVEEEGIIQS